MFYSLLLYYIICLETDSAEDSGGRLEADYGQNEGQRCIPVGVLMQFCRGVLRMRIKSSDETYVEIPFPFGVAYPAFQG